MKSRRWPVLLVCLVAVSMLAILTIGCGDSTTADSVRDTVAGGEVPLSVLEGPQGPSSGETPQYGGTLVILHQYGPTNMGAWWEPARFMDYQASRFAVESLVGLDENAEPVPQLATSWEMADDFKSVTFHLREGVKFHDGNDFNAEAVRWNLQMQIDGPKTELDNVTDIEVLDEYTVRLTLGDPDPLLLRNLIPAGSGKMTSPAAYDEYGPVKVKRFPVGTGPFVLKSLTLGKEVVFERFEDYWQEGLPYLDAVKILVLPDYMSRKTAFLNGEGDILYASLYVDNAEFEAAGATIQTRVQALVTLAGNSIDPASPTNDIRVRQALTYAIDVPTIVAGVYEGSVPYTNQIGLEGKMGYNPDVVGHPYDPDKARDLLAQVGITPENPWKTELTYLSSEDYDQVYTLVTEYLDKVGIEVSLNPLEFAAWSGKNQTGWEGLGAMSLSYNPDQEYSNVLKNYLSEDAYQFGNHLFIPEEFNALYGTMLGETDLDERDQYYEELNKMAIDDYCLLTPLYALTGNIAVASRVKDNVWCVYSSLEYPVERIWIEQ